VACPHGQLLAVDGEVPFGRGWYGCDATEWLKRRRSRLTLRLCVLARHLGHWLLQESLEGLRRMFTDSDRIACTQSELDTRCAYPSSQNSDGEDVWTCMQEGGTVDTSGQMNGGVLVWEYEGSQVCKRTGADCLIGLQYMCGHTSARIALTTPCEQRTLVPCGGITFQTVQAQLDTSIGIGPNCGNLLAGEPLSKFALSVWFKGDCPTSFIVYPAELAECAKAYLETVRFDCAVGLTCGATGLMGGCAC
jgi:hypothetical protein